MRCEPDKFSGRIRQYASDEFQVNGDEDGLLGTGGFGEVRKYHHKDLKVVAIKRFPITGGVKTINKGWEMVQREANILCRFCHPNIVEIFGITKWSNTVGIVMEYVGGGNLLELLAEEDESVLTWDVRLQVAGGIVSALSYIHNYEEKKKFCHGDLKPENVLLTTTLQVKLADFGSAAFLYATGASATTLDIVPTKQHTLLYVAPEVLKDPLQNRNPAMDMYSFGSVLYEIISRKAPYTGCFAPPGLLRGLMVVGKKPDMELVNQEESQLESVRDRSTYNLLKSLMVKCWNDDPASRPGSKTVEMEINVHLRKREQNVHMIPAEEEEEEQSQQFESDNVSYLQTRHRKNYAISLWMLIFFSLPMFVDTPRSNLQQIIDDQDTFSATELFFNASILPDIVNSNNSNLGKLTLEDIFETKDLSMLPDVVRSAPELLEKYKNLLMNKSYEEAELLKATLRSVIVNYVDVTGAAARLFGKKYLVNQRYLESIVFFDAAAALFGKMKTPSYDMRGLKWCVEEMKRLSEWMIREDSSKKVIVTDYVIPLMRDIIQQMKGKSQVSDRWRRLQVKYALAHLEMAQGSAAGDWEEKKRA